MIAKLTGVVDSTGEDWVVVDVGGVGYLVYCSTRTLGRLGRGSAASLQIETQVREDAFLLYGFLDEAERDWFKMLTTVQGVGAKVGLAILSVLTPDEVMHAIAAADRAAISRAAGVGPKLATRIISELKDKAAGIGLGPAALAGVPGRASTGGAAVNAATSEAASALVNLGFSPSDALAAVSRVAGRLGAEAGIEALIKGGLAELGPREHGA